MKYYVVLGGGIMPVVDFKEISVAYQGGERDSFELFAREFLDKTGFNIVTDPDRGADGGRDIIVSENRQGIAGVTEVKWLVSCKHKAHSGQSVRPSDELGITDRIRAHGCNGFIGFYSTIASSGLAKILEGIKINDGLDVVVFDSEKIERLLLEDGRLRGVLQRFFPKTYKSLDNKTPSNLFDEYSPLKCRICGKDLIRGDIVDKYEGNIVFVNDHDFYEKNNGKMKYVDIYCVCKGKCDDKMEREAYSNNCSTSWNDISDLIIPIEYLKLLMSIMNRMRAGKDVYTDEAYYKLKEMLICLSQIVFRHQTDEEIKRSKDLAILPDGI